MENTIFPEHPVAEIDTVSCHWKYRFLSPISRVVIAKTLMLSKLTHVAFALPSLNRNTILKIEINIFNFIWGGKPDKVARDVKKLEKNGGLNFSDIFAS